MCDYQGYDFRDSRPNPNAYCIDGYLFDLGIGEKRSDEPLAGGDMPCPQCNADAHAAYFTDCTETCTLSDD